MAAQQDRSEDDIKLAEYPPDDLATIESSPGREQYLADIELGPYFNRVHNLVWTKRNSYYKEALEDCKELKKSIGEKLARRERRTEELTNQIYNVVGFFSVFQGVILTAVTQLSQAAPNIEGSLCGKLWSPIVLSALAAIVAAVGIGHKFRDLNSIDNIIHCERLDLRAAETREAKIIEEGKEFKFTKPGDGKTRPQKSYWFFKGFLVIGTVFVLTAILILSFVDIMCGV